MISKLKEAFANALAISTDQVHDDLKYRGIPEWDSISHMVLISELEEELTACYSEIQDAETTEMADGTVSLINQIAPLLPALADKYFEMQERKIKAMQNQQMPPQQPPQQQNDQTTTIYEDYGI